MSPTRGSLFTSPAYTGPLTDSAHAENGWTRIAAGETLAPLWLKDHSWGEFVFDQVFARAYQGHGLAYYPKIVCSVPYTPVPGPRLGNAPSASARELRRLCDEHNASGAHVLFLPAAEADAIDEAHWLRREDIRFVWHNRDFDDFDDFLETLNSKRRKNLRAERRKVTSHGLEIQWQPAVDITDDEWTRIYALYASTYEMRGQAPYLSETCLRRWGENHPASMLFCLARAKGEIAAMAFFFRDKQHLYGRHWGAARDWPGLHFELCYYQGIDYAIAEKLTLFDAGVQGSHRLLRGFVPEISTSLHHFCDPRFAAAIGDYLQRERNAVRAQFSELQQSYGTAASN